MQEMAVSPIRLVIVVAVFLSHAIALGSEGRTSISLNGTWRIDESVSASDIPQAFGHAVVVPGMVNLSTPPFPDVDLFASREYLQRFGRRYPGGGTILPASAPLPAVGISQQKRNYFWYQRSFTVGTRREVALLKVSRGEVWDRSLAQRQNVGEHLSCWTAGYFDLTRAIHWQGENQLLVRVGAFRVSYRRLPVGTSSSKHQMDPSGS